MVTGQHMVFNCAANLLRGRKCIFCGSFLGEANMGILIYQPTPVLIPEDCACRRDFISRQSTVDNAPLTETDYRKYDSRTLFYDVFRCDDDRKVVAIGPPPVNLRNELKHLKITCGGRRLPHRKREYRMLCVLELTCDQITHAGKALPLRFSFPSFHVEIEVAPPIRPSLTKTYHLGLMTLQRNNPLPWILDWCRWHHRLHGVSRLVLYDNASDNRDALATTLAQMDEEIDVVLVDWPFPHGPVRSHKNRFCQLGAQNHYLLRFGSADAWCLNLDIDECLVVRGGGGGKTFKQYLHDCESNGIIEVLLDSFSVPPHQGQPAIADRRISSYWFRNREHEGTHLKFAFKPQNIEYVRQHMAYPKNRSFAKLLILPRLFDKTCRFFYGSLRKRLPAKRIFRFFSPDQFALRYLSPDEIFFYHFRGLNTNWRNPKRKFGEEIENFDTNRHVSDPLINELFVRAGLNDDHE